MARRVAWFKEPEEALADTVHFLARQTIKRWIAWFRILVRHGQTTANRQGIILGQRNYPLTVEGLAMTRKLAALLPESHQGMIVTSPIGRTQASAGIYAV